MRVEALAVAIEKAVYSNEDWLECIHILKRALEADKEQP